MIVDFDGRILAQADPGPGEKIVVSLIDMETLRAERDRRMGHHLLSHLRTELYSGYGQAIYPGGKAESGKPLTIEGNNEAIKKAREILPVVEKGNA